MSDTQKSDQAQRDLVTSVGTCFVIMPFSKTSDKHTEGYWTSHFEQFLKPIIVEATSLDAKRSEAMRGDIITQIVFDLVTSAIVIADLTDHNPNVYWELGVRQSFKHGTITIAEEGTSLPFDIGNKGTLFYAPDNHIKMQMFNRKLKSALIDCIKHPKGTDSNVLEILGGRGSLIQIFTRDETLRKLDALLSECNANKEVLNTAFKRASDNQEYRKVKDDPEAAKKIRLPIGRPHLPAVELLITNRYIDETNEFYSHAERYYDNMLSFADQLNAWENSVNPTESWIIKAHKVFEKNIMDFETSITKSKETITKQLL